MLRLGHIRRVEPGRIALAGGDLRVAADAVVVHCAASGLKYPPLVPVWSAEAITLQSVRAGFPCFGAAVIGYVEATRDEARPRVSSRRGACSPPPPDLDQGPIDAPPRRQYKGGASRPIQPGTEDVAFP